MVLSWSRHTRGALVVMTVAALLSACTSASPSGSSSGAAAPTTSGASASAGSPALGASPSSAVSPVASTGVTITLYNGQHASTTNALVAAFTQDTGIQVNVRSGEGSGLTNQIIEEGSASPADVVFTENSPDLMVLSEKELLAKVDPQTLAKVPSQYNSPNGDWVGVDARAAVLVYNPSMIQQSQLPQSILDLADPFWKGKIGIAPAENDFQPVVTAVIKLDGEDKATQWLQGLKTNAAQTYNGNTAILNAVDNGQIAAGIINNYYWFRQAVEVGQDNMKSSLYYFGQGDPGALVDVSEAGAIASSKHPAEAQAFLNFLVSTDGQQVIATANDFEYPLGSGVQADPRLKPFDQLGAPNVSVADLGDNSVAIQLLQQVGLL